MKVRKCSNHAVAMVSIGFGIVNRVVKIRGFALVFSSARFNKAFKNVKNFRPRNFHALSTSEDSLASSILEEGEATKTPSNFVPYPFAYHQELVLTVDTLTNLGMGICRTEVDVQSCDDLEEKVLPIESRVNSRRKRRRSSRPKDGRNLADECPDLEEANNEGDNQTSSKWVIMVPNVIPGEHVRVRIYRNYKTYSDADLVDVISPSPNRVTPQCSLFEVCGGCQYQHMSIQTQRQWKQQQVQDLLERVGQLDPDTFPRVLPTCGTDEVYHYRSKITPHYDAPHKKSGQEPFIRAIGFKEKNSRRIVDVAQCEIATKAINEELVKLRDQVYTQAKEGTLRRPQKGATLLLRDANEGVVTDPNQYVTTHVNEIKFRFLAGNFFQNNPFVVPLMVQHVVESAKKIPIHGKPMTHFIDCYCGSGLFCLSASKLFDVCVGIEVNQKAIEEAQDTAQLNNLQNCEFVAASAEAIFESDQAVQDFPRDQTVVVVDPPRKGCSPEFLQQLCNYAPQRVVYMSCDPSTQARDAKVLVSNGYEITSALPFDLFPQTRHIESLVIFERV